MDALLENLIIMLVSLVSSTVGAICGIGGGVVIKPVLDSLGLMSVAAASFLSGLTVLTMSSYSVITAFSHHESDVKMKTGLPLCIGAVVGGIVGKIGFNIAQAALGGGNQIGAIQAACLFVLVGGTLAYTFNKKRITTLHMESAFFCLAMGLFLGIMSSFLGIGGGPFNLIFLSFFFSMSTKIAAQNSLFIILCSQFASFLQTVFTNSVPEFQWLTLILMASMGLSGALIGRRIYKKLDDDKVDILFSGLNIVIMCICVYNFFRYIG